MFLLLERRRIFKTDQSRDRERKDTKSTEEKKEKKSRRKLQKKLFYGEMECA